MDRTDDRRSGEARGQEAELRVLRGIGSALFLGVIGFLLPVLALLGFTALRWVVEGANDVDRRFDLAWLPEKAIFSAIGTGFVFAGAAWATFAPRGVHRFVRTLAIVFAVSVPTWYALAFAGMTVPRLKSIRHPLIYPREVLLLAVPPIVAGLVLAARRSSKAQCRPPWSTPSSETPPHS